MAQYDGSIATALRLLTKFGEASALVRRVDPAPADPDEPWELGAPSETEYPVKAAWLNAEVSRGPFLGLVQEGDQVVYVAASGLSVTPDPSLDSIKRASGDRWSIEAVRTLSPNGQLIMHELLVRK
jgi:hypothetical protein